MSAVKRYMVAIALAFATPAASPAQIPVTVRGGDASEVQEQADGSVLHRGSGIRFPKMAGSMEIGKIVVYRAGDASAIYYASGKPGDTLLSFYIYPAAQSLDAEERVVIQSIEQAWTAKRVSAPIDVDLPVDIRTGWYDVQREGASGRSVYAVARRGDWFLKARVTTPPSAGDAGLHMVRAGLLALPWNALAGTPEESPAAPAVAATKS